MNARYIVGDVFDAVASLAPGSVQSIITSPPYWRKRAYLPADHPEKANELGQEDSPGEFLANLLRLMDALWDVLADDGTFWVNLGDTAAGSGGAGGDYADDGMKAGQNPYEGSGRATSRGQRETEARYKAHSWPADHLVTERVLPRRKSVCWIPQLFGASLAYGRNLLTGEPCRQWITRPPVTWCKPAPTPGEIIDKFREATELIVWGSKQPRYYFDLDAIREPPKDDPRLRNGKAIKSGAFVGHPRGEQRGTGPDRVANEKGVPPLTWWVINTSGYEGAHFATFPPELLIRPVIASCPPGGTILDPFGGSGTTAVVATGHGRNCVLVDLDERNADLALQRVGPMLLTVEHLARSLP